MSVTESWSRVMSLLREHAPADHADLPGTATEQMLAAAEERHEQLRGIFGEKVGLVHGKLPPREKDAGPRSGTAQRPFQLSGTRPAITDGVVTSLGVRGSTVAK